MIAAVMCPELYNVRALSAGGEEMFLFVYILWSPHSLIKRLHPQHNFGWFISNGILRHNILLQNIRNWESWETREIVWVKADNIQLGFCHKLINAWRMPRFYPPHTFCCCSPLHGWMLLCRNRIEIWTNRLLRGDIKHVSSISLCFSYFLIYIKVFLFIFYQNTAPCWLPRLGLVAQSSDIIFSPNSSLTYFIHYFN